MDQLAIQVSKTNLTVGVVLFNGYELLDVFGPLELFFSASASTKKKRLKMVYLSPDGNPVTAMDKRTKTVVDHSISAANLPKIDILFIPGGVGTKTLQEDTTFVDKLKTIAQNATMVLTVGTGSLLLASTRLVAVKATTSKLSINEAKNKFSGIMWQEQARFVLDGKFLSSSGVSAGIDMAHYFLTNVYGEHRAARAAEAAEYVPRHGASDDEFTGLINAGDLQEKHAQLARDANVGILRVAVVAYPNFEMLDTFGPMEMFSLTNEILRASGEEKGVIMDIVSEFPVVKSAGGPKFLATPFEDVDVDSYDMLLLPGGIGTLRELYNKKMHTFLRRLSNSCKLVMTVCTGSTLLASTGLLDGRRATSNKLAFDLLALFSPKVEWIEEARWIVDDKFYTSSGVSAGTDLALKVMATLVSPGVAEEAARLAEYVSNSDPTDDPFVGSICKPTIARKASIRSQRALIGLIFRTGFALGFNMRNTTSIVIP